MTHIFDGLLLFFLEWKFKSIFLQFQNNKNFNFFNMNVISVDAEICWKCRPGPLPRENYWIPVSNATHYKFSSSRSNETYVGYAFQLDF